MGEKKSFGHEHHDEAMRRLSSVPKNCDPDVKKAIEEVVRIAREHHERGERAMTSKDMLRLIAKHVDAPVQVWLAKYHAAPLSLSKMLATDGLSGTRYFDSIHDTYEERHGWQVILDFPDLGSTASAIIDLAFFCMAHVGPNEMALKVETTNTNPAKSSVQIVRAKKPGASKFSDRKKERPYSPIEIPKDDTEKHYCQLCPELNERANEILRLINAPDTVISKKDRELLRKGSLRVLNIPDYSPNYCNKHSPTSAPTAYAKALANRKIYDAARHFLRKSRYAAYRQRPGKDHIFRAASFMVVNECPDPALVKALPEKMRRWYFADESNNDGFLSVAGEMRDCMEQIIESFNSVSHPLGAFLRILMTQPNEEVYDAAKACGVLTERVEKLLLDGFLYDPLIDLIRRGGTIREI